MPPINSSGLPLGILGKEATSRKCDISNRSEDGPPGLETSDPAGEGAG